MGDGWKWDLCGPVTCGAVLLLLRVGLSDLSQSEVGASSQVDAGKTPSETSWSLVIAPKTLD